MSDIPAETQADPDGELQEGQGLLVSCIEEGYEENDVLDVPEMEDDDDEDDV